uniref:Uncharacterized protein n=1 Tax=Setaria viridis TaxID=4556 RepID=A0A4U6WC71_SETVI|nr:hypothetical protein SEVIR_1G124350v2 [Setaria viridis]
MAVAFLISRLPRHVQAVSFCCFFCILSLQRLLACCSQYAQ